MVFILDGHAHLGLRTNAICPQIFWGGGGQVPPSLPPPLNTPLRGGSDSVTLTSLHYTEADYDKRADFLFFRHYQILFPYSCTAVAL